MRVKSYVVAVLSVVLAFACTSLLQMYLRSTPSLPFVVAVMFSSLYCGLGPGLLSSLLSVLALTYFFLPPFHSFRVESVSDAIDLVVFCIVATSVNALNLAKRRAEEARRQLLQERLAAVEAEAKILRRLLPVCAWCKKIQDEDRWVEIEIYAREHLDTEFSHGICPECRRTLEAR